jgi:threonine dehydrogenase-like Zn-dependent dehydrogenase
MEIVDAPEPSEPAAGEVILRPEAVGICGSDFHFLLGELTHPDVMRTLYPKIQGHEIGAVIEEIGPDCPPGLAVGTRVAVWPLTPCGGCYPCRTGRENACANLCLIGIHVDGALQERLRVPATQVFPVEHEDPRVAAFVEPVSIAVRTADRGRIAAGEKVAVIGAGPIGQAVTLVARQRGASVLLVDLLSSRLEHGSALGADVAEAGPHDELVDRAREWSGGDGPDVVVDATGVPAAIRAALDMVASTGRVVVTGIGQEDVSLPIVSFTAKEVDVLGVSCQTAAEFEEAVRVVLRDPDTVRGLITHEFPLERTPEALRFAMENPAEVMKAVVRLD